MAFFDEAGRPTRHKDGYAKWTAKYDERNKEVERAFLDEAGRPVQATFINYGIAPVFRCTRMAQEYNDRGRLIRTTFGIATMGGASPRSSISGMIRSGSPRNAILILRISLC